MPVWYTSASEEHAAVREAAGLFDIGHMGLIEFTGPEQVDFLRYRPVLANDRLRAAFPGLPRLTTAQCYARFRSARGG